MTAPEILTPVKPCRKCGACDRDKKNHCKACAKEIKIKYYQKNREKLLEYSKAWNAANPEKCKLIQDSWMQKNPDAGRIQAHNRRITKKNSGKLSKGLAEKLFVLQKGTCPCCKKPLGSDYHMDHIIPISLGGPNTGDNIQLLRQRCNNQKHAKDPIDFMQSRGFLL